MSGESLLYVNRDDFLYVEYIRRTGSHIMKANHYHDCCRRPVGMCFGCSRTSPCRSGTPRRCTAKFWTSCGIINESYAEPLSLQGLAERFYVSPYHLSRTFKEATGFTFTDYVNLTRIKEAQRLLRETALSVTEVAAASGFDNFSHFGKTFKNITLLTPRTLTATGPANLNVPHQ